MYTLTQAKDLVINQGYAIKNDDTVEKLNEVISYIEEISESISGDKHHSKKLNKEQVFEIISSKEKPTALARKFNVTYRTIYNIQKRKNWKIID